MSTNSSASPSSPKTQLVLSEVPADMIRQLEEIAQKRGTSVALEAARIIDSYLAADTDG